jgi:hypothetical protein
MCAVVQDCVFNRKEVHMNHLKCRPTAFCRLLYRNTGKLHLHGVYKVFVGNRQGQQVWIVDGDKIWSEIYPAFVMGGNDQRYRFNPPQDVQIDDGIGIEELRYTVEHELLERHLMLTRGWTYDRSHNQALALEKRLRTADGKQAARHNRKRAVELNGHPVYRQFYRTIGGVKVWLVDGPMVREFFDGNYCFADHGVRKNSFIPRDEIWLDSSMGVMRALLSLTQSMVERGWMLKGHSYADAYPVGLAAKRVMLTRHQELACEHEASLAPVTYGTRERGVPDKPRLHRGRIQPS